MYKHNNIYLVEYPKSGITFLSHLLGNIELELINSSEVVTYFNNHMYIPDIHQMRGSVLNYSFKRSFIKSHFEYNSNYFFVIYLIRNPIDTLVSYYNFSINEIGYNKTFLQFLKDKSRGVLKLNKHIDSWALTKDGAQRMLWIKFEDLLQNTELIIRDIYLNLGLDLEKKIIQNAIKKSSLIEMKKQEELYRAYNKKYIQNFVGSTNKLKKEDIIDQESIKFIKKNISKNILDFYPSLFEEYDNLF